MPSIPLRPPPSPPSDASPPPDSTSNPLPTLLHTPSGLGILELQGSVSSSSSSGGSASGTEAALPLGRVVFPGYDPSSPETSTWDGQTALLYIGKHQRMQGEVKTLPKPLAVLQRRPPAEGEGETRNEELFVAELVKVKILFRQRPEPVGAE